MHSRSHPQPHLFRASALSLLPPPRQEGRFAHLQSLYSFSTLLPGASGSSGSTEMCSQAWTLALTPLTWKVPSSFGRQFSRVVKSTALGLYPSCIVYYLLYDPKGLPRWCRGKESDGQCRKSKRQVWSLGWEGPLVEEMATHSSIFTWRIPWTDMPGWLQFVGSQKSDTT